MKTILSVSRSSDQMRLFSRVATYDVPIYIVRCLLLILKTILEKGIKFTKKKLYFVFCLSLDLFFVFLLICFLSFIYFLVSVDGSEAKSVRLLSLTITNILKSNCHVSGCSWFTDISLESVWDIDISVG